MGGNVSYFVRQRRVFGFNPLIMLTRGPSRLSLFLIVKSCVTVILHVASLATAFLDLQIKVTCDFPWLQSVRRGQKQLAWP